MVAFKHYARIKKVKLSYNGKALYYVVFADTYRRQHVNFRGHHGKSRGANQRHQQQDGKKQNREIIRNASEKTMVVRRADHSSHPETFSRDRLLQCPWHEVIEQDQAGWAWESAWYFPTETAPH